MTHDVFISYSSKDKTVADAVCAKLEEKKIRAWIAPRDVSPGKNFAESIIEAIDTCKVFILIWSANTNTSEHILNEINQAFSQGLPIIPFRIEDVQPTNAMRYYIGRTHWLDAMSPPLEQHIGKLIEIIEANLGQVNSLSTTAKINTNGINSDVSAAIPTKTYQAKRGLEGFETSNQKVLRKKSARSIAIFGFALITVAGLYLAGFFNRILPENLESPFSTITPTTAPTRINNISSYLATMASITTSNASSPIPTNALPPSSVPLFLETTELNYRYPFNSGVKDTRYLYVKKNVNYFGASGYCEAIGGYLVSIETESENEYIFLKTHGVTWLGGSDPEGIWSWATGRPMVYVNWEKGKPDGEAKNVMYGLTFADSSNGKTQTWTDLLMDMSLQFVCEWDREE